MAILNFDYGKAIRQADNIDAVASDMLNVANNQLQKTLDSIGACWQGDASRQFIGYCTSAQDDIRKQAKNLQDLAQRIRRVARTIKEAEERARELQRQKEAAAAAEAAARKNKPSSGDGGGGGAW